MKKTYFKFLNALVILFLGLSFVACSGDDDDDNDIEKENPKNEIELIIGKWISGKDIFVVNEDGSGYAVTQNAMVTYYFDNVTVKDNILIAFLESTNIECKNKIKSISNNELIFDDWFWSGQRTFVRK